MASPAAPTAVLCSCDSVARAAYRTLLGLGLEIPRDVSVVGFDDLPESRHFHPPLTTIRQDFQALGHEVVRSLIAAIEQRPTALAAMIQPHLVVRESTAAPAAS